ncbi:MFS transporter [Streptomyces sp. NPDC051907]|uniref:MFS transporter n=1 Tax=Streptomyces sp. NPDC051907 TaxID=3155284 RepID=UPI0034416FF3
MSLYQRRAALKERIPGGLDGRRMLWIALVDKTGAGLWAATAALYFTYVTGLSVAQVGILVAVSAGIGIAGAPIAGRIADRLPLTRVLIAMQVQRAAAGLALLATDDYALLIGISAVASVGDRAANVLTKLYAARITGPDRVRYQAVNRTVSNGGFAIGGLAAATALGIGTTLAYQSLLVGNAVASLAAALLTLRCGEAPSPTRIVTGSGAGAPAARPASPWRDRTYLFYTASETVLFLDDAVFKVGLPLWIVHATDAPHGLAPLLLVLNNVMVVALQIPLARYGATTQAAVRLLLPLAAAFAAGALAMSLSAVHGAWIATAALVAAAALLTLAEILHATVSWELSLALAPDEAQGAYLGAHGLAQASQRSIGPLVMTAVIAAGPAGWALLGAGLAATCLAQHRLVRDHLPVPALSVPPATVSHK